MNTPTIINKIELTFWDHAIPLMSESKTVQAFVRKMYPYTKNPKNLTRVSAAILGSAGFGLLMGYFIGIYGVFPH